MGRLPLVAESVDADALARGELPLAENGTFVVGRSPRRTTRSPRGTGQPGQADCPEARRLRTKSCFGNGGKRGPRASSRTAAQVFDLILTRQQWAHSVLQRPQQASATRGLLAATGCAAGSFTQKAWQYAQNEPHLPVQSLWELKPDLSEIRSADNFWHGKTVPKPRAFEHFGEPNWRRSRPPGEAPAPGQP